MRKSKSHTLTCSVIFAIFIIGSIALCGVVGNIVSPGSKLITECMLPENDTLFRLYERSGSGVTTSDSSTITYQEHNAKEITIFSAYSSPAVKNMLCEPNQIALIQYADDDPTIFLSLSWIKSSLVHKPLTFYKSKLTSPEYKDDVSDWKGIIVP